MSRLKILTLLIAAACRPSYEFLVEETFEGPAVVVYGDPKGVAAPRRFRIPKTGVLFVSGTISDGSFTVLRERIDGTNTPLPSEDRLENSDSVGYFNYVVIGGNLNECLPEAEAPFNLVTFVVGNPTKMNAWHARQEALVVDATMRSLEHRGLDEARTCFSQRPHQLPQRSEDQ